jgi:hypothetical protein
MAILRTKPGELVPSTGTYALVGHFGEATSIAEWFNEGERFPHPSMVIGPDVAPLWWVEVYEANQAARIA